MTIETSQSLFRPAIQNNGFAGSATAVPHRIGYAIEATSEPVAGGAYSDPLSYNDATTTVSALAALDVRRHHLRSTSGTGLGTRWRWMIDHEFVGDGPRSVTFALWNHVGGEFTGFFSGRPTYWGAYVYGVPTAAGTGLGTATRRYRGLAGMTYLFPDVDLNRFLYGPIEAVYDPATQTIVVSLTMAVMSQLSNFAATGGSITENTGPIDPVMVPQVFRDPLTCTASVDPGARTFQCSLPSVNGRVSGRFFGASGDEIGAVFHRWEFSGSNTNWGPVGGFAAKASP